MRNFVIGAITSAVLIVGIAYLVDKLEHKKKNAQPNPEKVKREYKHSRLSDCRDRLQQQITLNYMQSHPDNL